jgi:hypothetical protein
MKISAIPYTRGYQPVAVMTWHLHWIIVVAPAGDMNDLAHLHEATARSIFRGRCDIPYRRMPRKGITNLRPSCKVSSTAQQTSPPSKNEGRCPYCQTPAPSLATQQGYCGHTTVVWPTFDYHNTTYQQPSTITISPPQASRDPSR